MLLPAVHPGEDAAWPLGEQTPGLARAGWPVRTPHQHPVIGNVGRLPRLELVLKHSLGMGGWQAEELNGSVGKVPPGRVARLRVACTRSRDHTAL